MGLGMWFFWILLIVIVVVPIKVMTGDHSNATHVSPESPLETLKARYARGEIDEVEFERHKRKLEK